MTWYETFGPQKGWAAHRRITTGLGGQVDQPYGASRQADLPATAGKENRRRRRRYVPYSAKSLSLSLVWCSLARTPPTVIPLT